LSGERCGDAPSLRNLVEAHDRCFFSLVGWIHENLSQIEKCVMRIELCSKRSGRIDEHLIFNDSATLRAADLPPALIQLTYR